MYIVQENLVYQQRQFVFKGKCIQHSSFGAAYIRTSRIIGMNYDQCARALVDGLIQRREIDLPPVVVKQWVG